MEVEKPQVDGHKVSDSEKPLGQDPLYLKTKVEFTLALIELMEKLYRLDTNKVAPNLEALPSRRHGA